MLPQELTQLIGKTGEPVILEVEKGAIKRFADAVGDRNPLYWDEEHARNSRYGSIVAPPGFFGWPTKWRSTMPFLPELRQELVDTITSAGYGINQLLPQFWKERHSAPPFSGPTEKPRGSYNRAVS